MSFPSLSKDKIKIMLLEGVHPSAVEVFERDGYRNIETQASALGEAQLASALQGAYLLGIRSTTQVTERVLSQASRLIAVGCFCIGTNQVALGAAERLGIPVFNAPFSNTRSVAELVLAEIIFLMRGIPLRNAATHRGQWIKTATHSREVRGKTLGIIGYGHIGTQVGVLAEGFGMQVQFFDVENKLTLGNARAAATLHDLLATSDIVTLHVPETPETCNMIGERELGWMKPGSHLINAARGTVVDIHALRCALQTSHIAGAALDVFPEEPKGRNEEFVSPLRGLDNVILTPHIAGSTEEAQRNIGIEVASKLVKYSNNGSTLTAVNFPEVSLPEHPGKHRLLHIHRNQPGVLSQLNAIFSEQKINVTGQYLQTTAEIGYVVVDIEVKDRSRSLRLKKKLEDVTGTIRTRILY